MVDIGQQLESAYRDIYQQRMQDMPVCNPVLRVEAIGFREWGEFYFGIMLTPWFMNLMLVPQIREKLVDINEGAKQLHVFPSGRYEFICGQEAGLGKYLVCSLFSPMFDFQEQQIAIDTANSVIDEMMQADNRDTISTHEKTIEKMWHGEQEGVTDASATPDTLAAAENFTATSEPELQRETGQAMSRRDFLRVGRRPRGEQQHGD